MRIHNTRLDVILLFALFCRLRGVVQPGYKHVIAGKGMPVSRKSTPRCPLRSLLPFPHAIVILLADFKAGGRKRQSNCRVFCHFSSVPQRAAKRTHRFGIVIAVNELKPKMRTRRLGLSIFRSWRLYSALRLAREKTCSNTPKTCAQFVENPNDQLPHRNQRCLRKLVDGLQAVPHCIE